jgi:hypothetical protein
MIPNNTFVTPPIVSAFPYPISLPFSALSETVWGGTALNDGAAGRLIQLWSIWYDGLSIHIKPSDNAIALSLTVPNVIQVSLAFDPNMSPVICWEDNTGHANLYYYDTISAQFITLTISATSCNAVVDDAAQYLSGFSDVIFSYTFENNLYYRRERDRYAIQYLIGSTTKLLRRVGLNVGNRLQFELA